MKRILAHKIYYLDKIFNMSVATIEGNRVMEIRPYEKETASTIFISGSIRLVPTNSGVDILKVI